MNRRQLMIAFVAGLACLPTQAGFRGARYKTKRSARVEKRGERAAVENLIEFHVSADEPFPIRALDPILHVGAYDVVDYRYGNMENTLLIFTCNEPAQLQDNAPVFLQYGNDTRSRTDLLPYRANAAE